ncbi:MAG: hypothetical protein ACLRVT_05560 [Oscillospiraceae bacterium]
MNSSKKAESKLAPFGMLLQFSKGLRGTFAWSIVITAVSILLSYLNPQVIRIIGLCHRAERLPAQRW